MDDSSSLLTRQNLWRLLLVVVVIAAVKLFGQVGLILSMIVGIFCNLGSSSGEGLSAYSVFNRNQEGLMGDLRAEDVDSQLRHESQPHIRHHPTDDDEEDDDEDGHGCVAWPRHQQESSVTVRSTRGANKPCICGSGLKTKKCCG
eukprot:GHVQ01030970.1.p1 GENE.GHVQ01030970.1~~GHVQ01030970.1.p1  ORF type:complete len:145 (+),score=28.43 GHVQ01030970.1:250-684(+)